MNRHALHASLLVITLCVSVGAQDAAIVTGSVTDAETGRPLVGANVVVVSQGEAVLGAVSRVDGRYTVRGVPPGTYTVTASHIGFGVHTKKEVVVGKGALVELAFALMEAELQLNPVTVTASPRSERLMDAPAEIGVLEKEEKNDDDEKDA